MRKALLALLLLCGQAGAVAPGAAAPEFSLAGANGQVNLADYRGKYVYVDFWASWCAPCKRSFPWMGTLQKRFGPSGLQVVAINVDAARADADRFLASTPAAFTIAYDPAGTTPRKYAIKGMPSSVLIDPQGQVLFVHAGFNDATAADIEAQIQQAVQKKEKP